MGLACLHTKLLKYMLFGAVDYILWHGETTGIIILIETNIMSNFSDRIFAVDETIAFGMLNGFIIGFICIRIKGFVETINSVRWM